MSEKIPPPGGLHDQLCELTRGAWRSTVFESSPIPPMKTVMCDPPAIVGEVWGVDFGADPARSEAGVRAEFSQKIATELTPYQQAAYDAYWAAENYHEEHRALQRMIALGLDTGCEPCPDPECVALRHIEAARQGVIVGGNPSVETDILAATREIARGG